MKKNNDPSKSALFSCIEPLKRLYPLTLVSTLCLSLPLAIHAQEPTPAHLQRVNLDYLGNPAPVWTADVNGDGSKVLLWTGYSLTPDQDNSLAEDLYLRDLVSGEVTLVNKGLGGGTSDRGVGNFALSDGGNFVVYVSGAKDIVPEVGPSASAIDRVYLYDVANDSNRLVSVNPSGSPANGPSSQVSISGDGRYIAFGSLASDLVAGITDLNFTQDVFLYDAISGAISLVSHVDGDPLTPGTGFWPSLSPDGTHVALVMSGQLYLQELATGVRTLVTRAPNGDPIQFSDPLNPDVSNGGDVVVFESSAPANEMDTWVPSDERYETDVFAFSRLDNSVTLISRAHGTNEPAVRGGYLPWVSNDGQTILYSASSNDVLSSAYDPFGVLQAVLLDVPTGQVSLVSSDDGGNPANFHVYFTRLSADGRFTLFVTDAPNLNGGNYEISTFLANNAALPGLIVDSDNDGLSDEEELALGTDPENPDTDGDRLNDGDEVNLYLTDPLLADSDGDGRVDGKEVLYDATDPNDRFSFLPYPIDIADPDADGVPTFVDKELNSAPGAEVVPFPVIVTDPIGDDVNLGTPLDIQAVLAAADEQALNIIVSYTPESGLFPDGDTTIEIYTDDDPTTGRPSYIAGRPAGVDAEVFVDHESCQFNNLATLVLFNPFEQFVGAVSRVCADNRIYLSIPLGEQESAETATLASASALTELPVVPNWRPASGRLGIGADSLFRSGAEFIDSDDTTIGQAETVLNAGVTVGASGTGSIEGTIWQDNDADGFRSPAENGLWIDSAVKLIGPGGEIEIFTKSDGTYRFGDLQPGTYTVIPGAGGLNLIEPDMSIYALLTAPEQTPRTTTSPASGARTVTVDAGATVTDVDFGQAVGKDALELTEPADDLSSPRTVELNTVLAGSIHPGDPGDFYSLYGAGPSPNRVYSIFAEARLREQLGADPDDTDLVILGLDASGDEIFPVSETTTEIGSKKLEFDASETAFIAVTSVGESTGYYVIYSANQEPLILQKGRQLDAFSGSTISIPFAADDEFSAELTWQAQPSTPELSCDFAAAGGTEVADVVLVCDHIPSVPSAQKLTITATDQLGLSDADEIILNVSESAPFTINGPAPTPIQIQQGTTESIPFGIEFNPDPTAAVTLTAQLLSPFCEVFNIEGNTWELECSPGPSDLGFYDNLFTAEAQGIGGTVDLEIEVIPGKANTPPQIQPIEDALLLESLGLWIDDPILIVATDADNDPITLSVTDPDLPAICTFTQTGNGTGEITCSALPTDQPAGVYLITVAASDGNASSTAEFTLTIDDAFDVEIGIFTPVQVKEGDTVSIPFQAVFSPDQSAVPVFSPEAMADFCKLFDNGDGSGEVSCNPQIGDAGEHTNTVKAEAAGIEDSFDLRVNVVKVQPENEPPVADFSYSCDELTCSFQNLSKDDKGLDNLLFAWYFTTLSVSRPFPDSIDVNPIHTYPSIQIYDVTLKVADAEGAEDSITKPVFIIPVDYEIVSIRGLPEIRAAHPKSPNTQVGQKTFTPVITFQNVSNRTGPARVKVEIQAGVYPGSPPYTLFINPAII